MAKPHLTLAGPGTVIGTVKVGGPPRRHPNAATRAREYLTDAEVQKLMKAAGNNRNGPRDATMVLLGLPAWPAPRRTGDAALGCHRLRPWADPCQPGQERSAIRSPPERARTACPTPAQARAGAALVFPVHLRAGLTVYDGRLAQDGGALGVAAKLGFKSHPHMLRHACGFQLANQGTDTRTLQAYLGHRNIQHTVRYTELSPTRFKNLWRD